MHYRSGLNMIPLIEWYRTHPDEHFLLEVSMGAMAGQLVNFDENGAGSMMWHAMPYVMDYDPHSCVLTRLHRRFSACLWPRTPLTA
jgi:hypothetical protein